MAGANAPESRGAYFGETLEQLVANLGLELQSKSRHLFFPAKTGQHPLINSIFAACNGGPRRLKDSARAQLIGVDATAKASKPDDGQAAAQRTAPLRRRGRAASRAGN